MKILIIAQRVPYPPNKGEKIRTFHQLKYLSEKGHQISLAAPYEDDNELGYFSVLAEKYCNAIIKQKLPHKIFRLPGAFLKGKALSVQNFYSSKLQSKIDQAISIQQFDVILCTASSVAEYIFRTKSLTERSNDPKLIMDFMDLDSDKWHQYADQAQFPMKTVYLREAKLIAEFECKIAQEFDASFFITETEKNLLLKNNPNLPNIYSVENGIDTSTFKPTQSLKNKQNPIFLFTGVMDYPPNIDAVLWFCQFVWPTILKHWPNATFFVAGMNPSEKIKNLAQLKGIKVTGFVDDIMQYFDQATIFVAPFRLARGVQNKVLQAFSCGIPVISSPMGAEGIRCRDKESILIAESPEEYIDHIKNLLNDESVYLQISKNALSIINEHYSWDGILAPFEKILTLQNKAHKDIKQ